MSQTWNASDRTVFQIPVTSSNYIFFCTGIDSSLISYSAASKPPSSVFTGAVLCAFTIIFCPLVVVCACAIVCQACIIILCVRSTIQDLLRIKCVTETTMNRIDICKECVLGEDRPEAWYRIHEYGFVVVSMLSQQLHLRITYKEQCACCDCAIY